MKYRPQSRSIDRERYLLPTQKRMGSCWLFHYVIMLRFGRLPTVHESLDVRLLGWTSSKILDSQIYINMKGCQN